MGILTKSFLLGLFSGVVAYGVNAGMDHLNDKEPDWTLHIINFFLWFTIVVFSTYCQLKQEKK